MSLPVIDMSALFGRDQVGRAAVATAIAAACEDDGFFYVVGHGIAPRTLRRLEVEARAFFDLPTADKQVISMARGGAAWRGWFPLAGELTSGRPDNKEGLYLGEELGADDPRVIAGWPLHGANLWPAAAPGLRPAVEAFFDGASAAAEALMRGVSLALGLDDQYFAREYLSRPTRLFRIFTYPPTPPEAWGVGEHTDYGLLTLLAQDDSGGLEVRARAGWRPAHRRRSGLQHRRYARAPDRRPVRLDAAPRGEPQRPAAPVVPVLLRSGLHRSDDASARFAYA